MRSLFFFGLLGLASAAHAQDTLGTDCYEDLDGDGFGTTFQFNDPIGNCAAAGVAPIDGDCDDSASGVNPAAYEVFCDGIDQDCDGWDGDCGGGGDSGSDCSCSVVDPVGGSMLAILASGLVLVRRRRD